MKRKEFGSEFHYPIHSKWLLKESDESFFSSKKFSFHFSGRSALYTLVSEGIQTKGWKNLYFPSYYCHEVVAFLKDLPINIHYFNFNPFLDTKIPFQEIKDDPTSVLVQVSFFGVKSIDLSSIKKATILEDYSHNLLALKESKADYCFGSLRKELPIPVGGFCYAQNHSLAQSNSNKKAEDVANEKLKAMLLKEQYLRGEIENKEGYRTLFQKAEEDFEKKYTNTKLPESATKILHTFHVSKILKQKHENVEEALKILGDIPNVSFNLDTKDANPFGLILNLSSNKSREALKTYLIKNNIFPAVLWPNQVNKNDQETEKCILFIHLDFRYTTKEVTFVANKIKAFFNE